MSRTVFRNGTVVSMDDSIGTRSNTDVLVIDGRIAQVGPQLEAGDAFEVDATHRIISPGFIDSHRHLWESCVRGLLPNGTLGDYFGAVMIGLGSVIDAEDVYAGTLLGATELLDSGVTTVVDWANCIRTPDHADAGINALNEVGIRAQYSYGGPGGVDFVLNSAVPHPIDAQRVAHQYFNHGGGLLTYGLALRGPVSNPPEVVQHDWTLARECGARITVHVGMRIPGVTINEIDALSNLDLLGSDTTYVHCNECTAENFEMIRDTGGTVSVSAYCENVMGHGHPPFGRAVESGLRPSISCDVVVTAPGDMFSHMRATYAFERSRSLSDDVTQYFVPTVTAHDILRAATIDGANALGLADRTGSITPGKDADLVLIRTDMLNTMPVIDPVGTIVNHANVSNVDSVYVRGKAVKLNGSMLHTDMNRLLRLNETARDRLMGALAPSGHQ